MFNYFNNYAIFRNKSFNCYNNKHYNIYYKPIKKINIKVIESPIKDSKKYTYQLGHINVENI